MLLAGRAEGLRREDPQGQHRVWGASLVAYEPDQAQNPDEQCADILDLVGFEYAFTSEAGHVLRLPGLWIAGLAGFLNCCNRT